MTRRPPPAPSPTEADADFSEAEIARRRDEVVRRMLNTPPQPQQPRKTKAKKRGAKTKA